MKIMSIKMLCVIGLMALMASASATPAQAEVSFDFFYSNLSPHGSWLVSGQYGRVWQPDDYSAGWSPYYDGHWVYADVGWTWVSDYSWGAIPYHYGTWVSDPALGWVWVPGYVWAPSWVVFRTGPDYIGWAPVSPRFTVGVSLSAGAPAGPFVFVSASNFLAPRIRTCVVPESRTNVIIRGTRVTNSLVIENNFVVNRGPDVRLVERATGRQVRGVPIEQVSGVAPGGRGGRDRFRVEDRDRRHGLRVAEPTPMRDAAPAAVRGERPRNDRDRSLGSDEPRQRSRESYTSPRMPAGGADVRAPERRDSRGRPTVGPSAPQREDRSVRGQPAKRKPPARGKVKQQKQPNKDQS